MRALILSHSGDRSALAVHEALRARFGESRVTLATGLELSAAPKLEHRITDGRGTFDITLADGRRISDDGFDVVFNRLQGGETAWFGGAKTDDLEYAVAETYASWMSILRGFRCPVVNPVSRRGLAGPGKSQVEWLMLAAASGLPVRDVAFASSARRQSTRALAPHAFPEDAPLATTRAFADSPIYALGRRPGVFLEPLSSDTTSYLVVGEKAVGKCPPELLASSLRLANRAICPILEISVACFGDDGSHRKVLDVNPLPQLTQWSEVQAVCGFLESAGRR
jgi:hypothetical protein